MQKTSPRWSSQTKLTVTLLLLALGIYLLYRFRIVIAPVILAIILAYILSPVVSLIENHLKIRRAFATAATYLILLAILVLLPLSIIPPLVAQAAELNLDIQRFLTSINELLSNRIIFSGQTIDLNALIDQLVGSLQGFFEPLFGQTLSVAVEVISSVVWVIFVFVASFYLIKDGASLSKWLENLVPPAYRGDYVLLRDEISQIWAAFFRGQIILALVVAIIITSVGFIIGLPFALAMGALAGLLELLPSLGHAIWLFIGSLLAFFLGSSWLPLPNWAFMLLLIGLHLIFEQFDLNYLIPRIIGRRVHLHPLVVILGIVTGAVFAGVLGIFLAAPTIASARVIGRYIYAYLFDLEPFPEEFIPERLPPPNVQWWRRKSTTEQTDSSQES